MFPIFSSPDRLEPSAAKKPEVHYAQVKRLLHDMPWLWAVRTDWNAQTRAYVCPARYERWLLVNMLEYEACHLYIEAPDWQEVRRVEFSEHVWNMYYVLDRIGHQGINLNHIKCVVTEDPKLHFLSIYRAKGFQDIFLRCVLAQHDMQSRSTVK